MKSRSNSSEITELTFEKEYHKAWFYSQKHLLLESAETFADMYDIENHTVQFTLNDVSTPISVVLGFSPALLLTGTKRGLVQLWHVTEASNKEPLNGETIRVSDAEINSLTALNESQFVATDMDNQLTIWDSLTKQRLLQRRFNDYVYAVRVLDNENLELLTTNFCKFDKIQFSTKTDNIKHIASFRPDSAVSAIPIHLATLSPSGQVCIIRTEKATKSMNSIWVNQFEGADCATGNKTQIVPHQFGKKDHIDMRETSVATVSTGCNRACFFFPKFKMVRLVELPDLANHNNL